MRSMEKPAGRDALNPRPFRRKYWLYYTLCFAAVCLVVLSWFYLRGRTLIYNGDGWKQHYKALVYYGRYLRSIAQSVLSGNGLVIPHWDPTIGEGSDILTTLHYYVIGDPFTIGSVFFATTV